MTSIEIKTEINKVLDTISEESLKDILSFLKTFQEGTDTNSTIAHHLQTILQEDRDLLKKLAQ